MAASLSQTSSASSANFKWTEVLEAMYVQAGLDLETSFFPADEIIRARETGALGEMLPSGVEFPVMFANGERNVLVVCRDKDHTCLVTRLDK